MIRPAIPSDEPAIRLCAESAYVRYVVSIGRKPAPMLADYGSQIAAGRVYVATDTIGQLLGFIVFFPVDRHMLLENVAVQPSSAGQGVGKALVRFCEDEATRSGCEAVRLYTNARMTENLTIYPKLGYAETDRRTEDGFDRIFFEKRLG